MAQYRQEVVCRLHPFDLRPHMLPSTAAARITALDLVRGISALIVMMGHLRNAVLPDFSDVPHAGWLLQLFYLVSGMGHQAVIVFFVLSGYFVGGVVLKAGAQFSWRSYLIARVSRLWVVLLPALALTWGLDQLLLRHAAHVLDSAHIASWHCIPASGVLANDGFAFLGNLFFLQTVWVPVFGSNGPLWSLAYEAWYYLLFPLLVQAFRPTCAWHNRTLCAVAAALMAVAMPVEMLWLFPAWLLGAGLARTPEDRLRWLRHRGAGALALASFLGVAALARLHKLPEPDGVPVLPDLLLALVFGLWCLHVRVAAPLAWPRWLQGPTYWLSDVSFSLYLTHMPLVYLLVGLSVPVGKLTLGFQGIGVYLGLACILLAFAHAFWWLFERHAPWLRRQFDARLRLPQGAPI